MSANLLLYKQDSICICQDPWNASLTWVANIWPNALSTDDNPTRDIIFNYDIQANTQTVSPLVNTLGFMSIAIHPETHLLYGVTATTQGWPANLEIVDPVTGHIKRFLGSVPYLQLAFGR
jgi:hypothetical protein